MMFLFPVNRDVLPFPLELPDAIAKATTHRQLEAISHMGQGKGWNPVIILDLSRIVEVRVGPRCVLVWGSKFINKKTNHSVRRGKA